MSRSSRRVRALRRCRNCEPMPEGVRRTADLLERRWLLSVLYAAHSGALRFNEFKQILGGVPPRVDLQDEMPDPYAR